MAANATGCFHRLKDPLMSTADSRSFVTTALVAMALALWACLVNPASAQAITPADEGEGAARPAGRQDIPWPSALGLRSLQVSRALPLADQVVLVPDGATYLDELAKWSPAGRWPVLIEDDVYAPLFIRAFQPARVIRRAAIGKGPESDEERMAAMEAVVVGAFGGSVGENTIREAFDAQGYIPPGVVFAWPSDPAWTAAVALAAGRGQPLLWLDGQYGNATTTLTVGQSTELSRRVESMVSTLGYSYAGLGDQIDAVTICRDVGSRAEMDRTSIGRMPAPEQFQEGPVAITDLLGRNRQYGRWAFAGWIFGDETRCAYVAMCSLFLQRSDVHLFNTYPDRGSWAIYGIAEAATILRSGGFDVRSSAGERATEAGWLNLLPRGLNTDVFVMNSKGHGIDFDLFTGTAYTADVPILARPVALHLIHSWSLRNPRNRNTVGGRWLERGAYAYVGAAHEPLLGAFVTPKTLAERCLGFVPFLVAARHWTGPYSAPWRINTFGDPLMVCAPPDQTTIERIAPTSGGAGDGTSLSEQAQDAMRRALEDDDAQAYAEAAAALELLGRDDLLIKLWSAARQKGHGAAAARPALAAFFRAGDVDRFMQAWEEVLQRDKLAVDMLWHLLMPRLGKGGKQDWLIQLQANIRRPQPQVDLRRLAPHLGNAFGRPHVSNVIQRELDKTEDQATRKKLIQLQKNW